MAPVHIVPKILSIEESFDLADIKTIKEDIKLAKYCFENFSCNNLFKFDLIHEYYRGYALATAGLVHYRRAFNTGTRKYKISVGTEDANPDRISLHQRLIELANKQIAHFASGYERVSPAISVAIDQETGDASVRGIFGGGVFTSLMSEATRMEAIAHFHYLLVDAIEPIERQLEARILEQASLLTPDEIKNLPDGFPPVQDDALKRSLWPRNLKA